MIIPTGYAQVNMIFTGASVPNGAEVTLGLSNLTSDHNPSEIAEAVETALEAADVLFAATLSTVKIATLRVKKGPNETGPFIDYAVDIPGTSVTAEGMPNCAYLVHKITTMGGRKGRGRAYWPGAALSETDNAGNVGVDARNGVTDGWNSLITSLASADLAPVLLHSAEGDIPNVITEFICDARLATQRRRLRD